MAAALNYESTVEVAREVACNKSFDHFLRTEGLRTGFGHPFVLAVFEDGKGHIAAGCAIGLDEFFLHRRHHIVIERGEKFNKVPMLIMQGALDDNVMPAVQEKFVKTYRAAGGDVAFTIFEDSEHEWVAKPGPQTLRAQEMVKAFIARNLARNPDR